MPTTTVFAIQAPSAYRMGVNCLLGSGATEAAAWEDAFGPKPWTPSTRKAARNAWATSMTEEEFHNLRD